MTVYKDIVQSAPAVAAAGDNPSRSPVYVLKDSGLTNESIASETLYDTFTRSCKKHPGQPCLGYRPVDARTGTVGAYTFMTYKETEEKVAAFASSLKAAGLQRNDRVAVFGANSPQWMIAMQACNRMAYPCVPLYDTLGENAIEFIMDHSESAFLVVSDAKLPAFAAAVDKLKRKLKGIVYWGSNVNTSVLNDLVGKGISVTPFEEMVVNGVDKPTPADPPTPDDLCTIMYTSGTTGNPKGVVLTHKAMRAAVASLLHYLVLNKMTLGPGDAFLSYLPLAHIFDRVTEDMFLAVGGKIGYWQAKLPELLSDIGALKPTLFCGVPRVFERVYNSAKDKIAASGCFKSFLFSWAFSGKLARLKAGFSTATAAPVWDKVVFSKMKQALGGNVKLIVSGGAPLARHVEEFLRVTMCCPVVQGYGLTETCAACFVSKADNFEHLATVGMPLPLNEFCLESVPDMNYDAQADPPRGELVVRGPNLFSGYLKEQAKTDEVLQGGFFHTGDIGELQENGTLKIVDRKKNIFKLSQGEYVAAEKLEAEYKKTALVNQVWIYGNSFENCLVAVVVPKEEVAMAFAQKEGLAGDFAAVCKESKFKAHVLEALVAQAKLSKLKGFEVVKGVFLDSEEFSVANDTLTPTFKLRRPQLLTRYQTEVDAMYAALKR